MAINIFKKIYGFYREHSKPRYYYIQRYLDNLEFSKKMSKEDKTMVNRIRASADTELKAVKKFHIISIILYGVIYFSLISFLLSELIILGELISTIGSIIGFIGTPVFIVAQFIVIRFRNIRFEKLSLYTSHLISYSAKKYPKP